MAVAVTLAMPEILVTAVVAESVALAPVVGAVNVTVAPATGLPLTSTTKAVSGVVKAEPTGEL